MNKIRLETLTNELLAECKSCFSAKGEDYTQGNEDRLINFKRNAQLTGMSPKQVWSIYFMKHIDAVMSWVKTDKLESSESLKSRFIDIINYSILGLALYEDQNKPRKES